MKVGQFLYLRPVLLHYSSSFILNFFFINITQIWALTIVFNETQCIYKELFSFRLRKFSR
jgi:hypothetical protein